MNEIPRVELSSSLLERCEKMQQKVYTCQVHQNHDALLPFFDDNGTLMAIYDMIIQDVTQPATRKDDVRQ